MWYDLDDNGNPVQLPDGVFPAKARWYLKTQVGDANISTVFLGLDHNYGHGAPILFETMVFGKIRYEDYQIRYYTKTEAEDGHEETVRKVEGLSGLLRKL